MNVLFLGKTPSPIFDILLEYECQVFEQQGPINVAFLEMNSIDFVVSYRYRHIVNRSIIEYLNGRIINLHISMLPWNRGADPNLWSFLDDTPKGVTIHYIEEGLDTGEILVQKEISYDVNETLLATYDRLSAEIEDLFRLHWPDIVTGSLKPFPQIGHGSYHRTVDKERFLHLLENGWDTPVKNLVGKGKNAGIRA